jgi:hypothetical protein
MNATRFLASTVLLSLILANVGCHSIGPGTVADDRIAYNDAIATSWKQQVLLNIVRLRYGDMVEFVDVSAINNSYSLTREASGSFNATFMPFAFLGNILSPGLTGTRTASDSPTITYTPQAGAQFNRNLLRPIEPSLIFPLVETGISADALMDLALDSINGIRNRHYVSGGIQSEDPGWTDVLNAIRDAHDQGTVSFPVVLQPGDDEKKVFMLIQEDTDWVGTRTGRSPVAIIREKLHLNAATTKFEIKFGNHAAKNDEIVVRTRSVLRVTMALSEYVQVPECHLADGRAKTLVGAGDDPDPLLRVYSGRKKPCDTFAAIQYQGYWFWVSQGDDGARSKRSIIYLRTFLALADTGDRPAGPVLTIPVR